MQVKHILVLCFDIVGRLFRHVENFDKEQKSYHEILINNVFPK